MTIRSAQFDDIYFSPDDGLAETRHVFLKSNNLPGEWTGRRRFVIAETGFGTGLNFLATQLLFMENSSQGQVLDYISFEKYPLTPEQIRAALAPWAAEFGRGLEELLAVYPLPLPGFHRLILSGGRVRLTLVFDDVNEALPQLVVPGGADVWFLDGFAPAKNPEMWSQGVFDAMARLSRPGTRFATFTAAGSVKRGLAAAGFSVEKCPGFGRKRDMLAGVFEGEKHPQNHINDAKRIAIIGGGLAGTSAAYILKNQGFAPVLFESTETLAQGASGNPLGLYNPRFSTYRTPESDFYTASWAQAFRTFKGLQGKSDIGFNPCGSLHLITNEDRRRKLEGAAAHWHWPHPHMQHLSATEAGSVAGIQIDSEALYLPGAGTVSPRQLCESYMTGIETRLGAQVETLIPDQDGTSWRVNSESFDAVILACGAVVRSFDPLAKLPVHTVRGQVTRIGASALTRNLKVNLCYGGYLSPALEGVHVLGATFQKWLDDSAERPEDDQDNIERLRAVLPGLEGKVEIIENRASFRCAARDHFPLIGPVEGAPGLYVSTAHGSHGLISTLAGAHLLADMITGGPLSLPQETVQRLAPCRFNKKSD